MKTEDYLWMNKYLRNKLQGEELNAFKKRLKEDASFKEAFKLYQETHKTLENRIGNQQEIAQLKNTLAQLEDKYISSKENKKVKIFSLQHYAKYIVAASVILVASILWFKQSKPLYTDYNNFENIELTVRSGSSNEHLKKAEDAFNSKKYAEAEKELETLLNEDKTKVSLQLYLAVCLMEQNKLNKAEKILKNIQKGKSIYKSKATWYLALSKLKREDYKACKKYLEMIPEDAYEYKDAKNLLKQL